MDETKVNAGGGQQAADHMTTLINVATLLLKCLRSLRAMRLKLINFDAASSSGLMALLDGGVTHGLRMAYESEISQLEQVEVELASGTALL